MLWQFRPIAPSADNSEVVDRFRRYDTDTALRFRAREKYVTAWFLDGGMDDRLPLTVVSGDQECVIHVERGETLRDALLDRGFSVYGTVSRHANCGGRGLCATCTVGIDPAPEPTHWHDAAAARFGYPRLSCQIDVEKPLRVELLDKYLWGQVLPRRLRSDG